MLTKLTIRNFKRFDEVTVDLASPVLLIGPNNSGKTSALQALALWNIGLKKWLEKRGDKPPGTRPGVTINRRDLIAVPVPSANLLWRQLHTRDTSKENGKQQTQNVRIDVVVEGISGLTNWTCGLEFDYANEESFYCRPLRKGESKLPDRMSVPPKAGEIDVAFLPPMSGLAPTETKLEPGAINVRIGEGRTADVLRNLCFEIQSSSERQWARLADLINRLFGVHLDEPQYIAERGEIEMGYRDHGVRLDLSSSGRGLQQTLLLLAYMYRNPKSILLLDEPDAHLEILRQRQIYHTLTETARENGSQIIAASHSEVLLNEAAERDLVVAFIGNPHPIIDQGSQLAKSLKEIGFEDYYQAEQTGWVLYLEGSTDLAFLTAFAKVLGLNDAVTALERPFVKYVGNDPMFAVRHYHGLREAWPNLKAFALFDRLERTLPDTISEFGIAWRRREIENYVCYPETLLAFAEGRAMRESVGSLFEENDVERGVTAMRESISKVTDAMATLGQGDPWDSETKVSDHFLAPLFRNYFQALQLPNTMPKRNFHELVAFVPAGKLDPEIAEVLGRISAIAATARSPN